MKNWRIGTVAGFAAALTLAGWSSASAETLLMPPRDMQAALSEVVWGVTTQANGTPFVLDYGDGTPQTTGTVADRSYINFNHTYVQGTFTVTLCVGAGAVVPGCPVEQATVQVRVFNTALLTEADYRNLQINRAIENGLRYMWINQDNRATNFPNGTLVAWSGGGYPRVTTALAILAFENHGYKVPNNDSDPVGIYQKYIVRRGLNYVINELNTLTLTTQTAGSPCVNVEAAPCVGLYQTLDNNDAGYETSIAALPLAGSSALGRHVNPTEVPGTRTGGAYARNPDGNIATNDQLTYGQVLQRVINAQAFGQIDVANANRGGWGYTFNTGTSDGSTLGWNVLAMLDSEAAGITLPAFMKTEYNNFAAVNHTNTDGTFDYTPDANPAGNSGGCCSYVNMARVGVGLQSSFFGGHVGLGDAQVAAAANAANSRWASSPGTDYPYTCNTNLSTNNKNCSYSMFNLFKGLKLQGITTLSNVNRVAGVNGHPVVGDPDDWYADYVDFLLNNQAAGGNWTMSWSCCWGNTNYNATAIAELILAPVALIAPDPLVFSTVGLKQGNPLSTNDVTGPVSTSHTVTAQVRATGDVPVPGATVNFTVLTGPNAGATGTCNPVSCISGASGDVTFTYNGGPNVGTDHVQANIGTLLSNTLNKIWVIPSTKCDVNNDGFVTIADLNLIRAAFGQTATGPNDPRDGNSDGVINIADSRYCALRLTPTN